MSSNPTKIDFKNLPLVINEAYYKNLGSSKRYEIYVGGAGSGKSVFVCQKLALMIMIQPGHKILALRKIGGTCENSIFAEFGTAIERLGVSALWRKRQSQAILDYEYIPNGGRIIFKGFDEPEKIKSIQGITAIWMEEATEFTPADLNQLDLRLRPPKPFKPQIFISFNPINIVHWLNKRFFQGGQKGKTSIHKTTHKDNKFLTEEYVEMIEAYNDPESATYDPYYYQVYGKGDWGVIGDLVYTHIRELNDWPWEVVYARGTPILDENGFPSGFSEPNVPSFVEIPFSPEDRFCGLDFGYNHPTALHEYRMFGDAIYVTEHIYQRKMTTQDIITWLNENEFPKNIIIYADSADPGAIEEIFRAGYLIVPADKGPGSVGAGIKLVKSLRIYTHENNVNFNIEVASYSWVKDKEGNTTDTPEKKFDHAMDNMRYALYTHLRGRVEEIDDYYSEDMQEQMEQEIELNLEQDIY